MSTIASEPYFMSKETPIETLSYFTHVIGQIMQRPLSDYERAALVVHVHKQLSDKDLADLYADGPCQHALRLTNEALANPRSFLPPALRPVAARTTAGLS